MRFENINAGPGATQVIQVKDEGLFPLSIDAGEVVPCNNWLIR
jgi:hypothetical protein